MKLVVIFDCRKSHFRWLKITFSTVENHIFDNYLFSPYFSDIALVVTKLTTVFNVHCDIGRLRMAKWANLKSL